MTYGSVWESNPQRALFKPSTGFEDQGPHQRCKHSQNQNYQGKSAFLQGASLVGRWRRLFLLVHQRPLPPGKSTRSQAKRQVIGLRVALCPFFQPEFSLWVRTELPVQRCVHTRADRSRSGYGWRCVFKRPSAAVTSLVSRASGSPPASFLRTPIAVRRGASFAERVEPKAATYSKTRTART